MPMQPARHIVVGLLKFERVADWPCRAWHLDKHVGPLIRLREMLLKGGVQCALPEMLIQYQFSLAMAIALRLMVEGIAIGQGNVGKMMQPHRASFESQQRTTGWTAQQPLIGQAAQGFNRQIADGDALAGIRAHCDEGGFTQRRSPPHRLAFCELSYSIRINTVRKKSLTQPSP